jgi:hypothetical protein
VTKFSFGDDCDIERDLIDTLIQRKYIVGITTTDDETEVGIPLIYGSDQDSMLALTWRMCDDDGVDTGELNDARMIDIKEIHAY